MSYKISLPEETMKDLWRLREYCGQPPIVQQIRRAVNEYLKNKEIEIGTSIEDLTETIAKHSIEERERNESMY